MINKIKDFVKSKLSRRKASEESDEPVQQDDPTGEYPNQVLHEEDTKPSLKDRLMAKFSELKTKYDGRRLKPHKVPSNDKDSGNKLALLSPSVGKNIEKMLSREGREPIHQVFLVTLICAVTYSLGKISALGLKGAPTLDQPKDFTVSISLEKDFRPSTLAQVKSINIFRTGGMQKKGPKADTKCEVAQQESNLPIKLINTVVLQDSIKSLASVQVRSDRDLQELREGEQISNLAKIFKIDRLEILVKNLESGVCESIISQKLTEPRGGRVSVMSPSESRAYVKAKPMPGIENTGNNFKIQKTLLDEKMKDIANILTQARAVKIQNPDGSIAFKLTEMDPSGIFPYLGLQDQDIITSINGKPIYDMNEVMSLFARIKNMDHLSLGVRREGSDSVQDYTIKK